MSPTPSSLVATCAVLAVVGCGPDPELTRALDVAQQRIVELEKANTRLEKDADKLAARLTARDRELKNARQDAARAILGLGPGQALSATFETSKGSIRCTLLPDDAPATVTNFVQLAEGTKAWTDPATGAETTRPLYPNTRFHRVKPNFMIQGGDPLGNGRGGPGYEFADETHNGLVFDRPGILAMANRGPDTNGSQFFITDRGTPNQLDGKHTIFGRCRDLDVVRAIADVPRGKADLPNEDIILRRVVITRGG